MSQNNQVSVIIMGDIVRSRRMNDSQWLHFKHALNATNDAFNVKLRKPLTQLSGDGIGGVADSMEHAVMIINHLFECALPTLLRLVVVRGEVQNRTELDTLTFSELRGAALTHASGLVDELKTTKALIEIADITRRDIGNKNPSSQNYRYTAIRDILQLLWLIKRDWTPRQRDIIGAYRQSNSQRHAAHSIGVSQQYVSTQLQKAHFRTVDSIERTWIKGHNDDNVDGD